MFTEELSESRINQIADAAHQQHEPIEMLCNFISLCILYNYNICIYVIFIWRINIAVETKTYMHFEH